MTSIQKYSFANNFDDVDELPTIIQPVIETIIEEIETEPAAMYTAEDLDIAKTISFEDGREAGYKEAELIFQDKYDNLLQKISLQITDLLKTADDLSHAVEQSAATIGLSIAKVFLQQLPVQLYQQQLQKMVTDFCYAHKNDDAVLSFTCSPSDLEIINKLNLSSQKIIVNTDDKLSQGDLIMSNGDGFSQFSKNDLMQQIDNFFNEHHVGDTE